MMRRQAKSPTGSPPQVRGKLDIDEATGGRIGITPAGAGKTPVVHSNVLPSRDHPRRCGENDKGIQPACDAVGSPPQVRGKHKKAATPQKEGRITPAGAGKTECGRNCSKAGEDHPRRCGENVRHSELRAVCSGSPPQVRGKPLNSLPILPSTGITPAGAGKTH